LPILSSYRETTRAGGFISYSADHAAHFRRVLNGRTAKALSLDVPPMLLSRVDEAIE
jgi:hypothetical protein